MLKRLQQWERIESASKSESLIAWCWCEADRDKTESDLQLSISDMVEYKQVQMTLGIEEVEYLHTILSEYLCMAKGVVR